MPRNADRLVGHLGMARPGSKISTGSGISPGLHKSSVFVYRPPSVRTAASGGSVRMPGSPLAFRLSTRRNSRVSSPHGTGPQRSMLAKEDDFDAIDGLSSSSRKVSIVEGKDGEVEIILEKDEPVIFTIFEAANIDGVQHLSSKNRCTRYTWFLLILIFVCMCFYQIATQAIMFWFTPIATNIAAAYPASIPFPVYRLTYLTGSVVQNRRPKNRTFPLSHVDENSTNVYDKALSNTWDMDAVKFLRNAAHWKARMIIKCNWPNGTRCRTSDFKPLWTLTGLCWALNSDPVNPVHVTGAGPRNALKVLVNIERYERIESCTPKLRTSSLPGLKILIYNQTDVPASSLEGVNVPTGFTMDIPFRMQHRQKLSGRDCIDEVRNDDGSNLNFDSPGNVRTCIIRSYLLEIEKRCNCTMRHAYNPDFNTNNMAFCNVHQYFGCAKEVLKWGFEGGFSNFKCKAPCDEVDYTAWQDMNELPSNIFPKLIDSNDDDDTEDEDLNEEVDDDLDQEHFRCEDNQLLEDVQVNRIKREAHRAFEKQSRYQEDILLRTKRLIQRMRQTSDRLLEMKWGYQNDDFIGVYERLQENVSCYSHMSSRHSDIFNAIRNPQSQGEEFRARQLHNLLDKTDYKLLPDRFKTIGDVKRIYGDRAEEKLKELIKVEEVLKRLHNLYSEDTFNHRLPKVLENRMERVLQLMEQYDNGQLQRRAWAEKMQSRNMKHFFDEDFYEGWYNLVTKDLDQSIIKTISYIEDFLAGNGSFNDTELVTGAVLLFGDSEPERIRIFDEFMDDILKCTLNEIHNYSYFMLDEFRKGMHDFQSAYANLFRKELPQYLENFDFGTKFVQENFAQINVFLHKMNVEHWIQEPTYSVWSLFCDIGGALGLFLGASLLTIIEVAYFVVHNKIYKKLRFWKKDEQESSPTRIRIRPPAHLERVMSAVNRHGSKFHKKKPFRVSSSTTSSEIYQNANEEWEPMLPHTEKISREEQPLEATECAFPPRRKFGSWDTNMRSSTEKEDRHKLLSRTPEAVKLPHNRRSAAASPESNVIQYVDEPERTPTISYSDSTTSSESPKESAIPAIQHSTDSESRGTKTSTGPSFAPGYSPIREEPSDTGLVLDVMDDRSLRDDTSSSTANAAPILFQPAKSVRKSPSSHSAINDKSSPIASEKHSVV
ncbi:amiloride-sensitive sodium channel domain-containing protein [Ditylenchus destructor]|uniref:Amiloride-sensitive sodium channel domain-containing protein n=1 Tax=Ditylenchus destructor TaxID=166010 RepID=A0AAD4NH04_9BILA|nr:amiloride-sensitive sodium channel domain-containing protein [Ditylenchus destructor]